MSFDLVVRGGTVVTASDEVRAELGVKDGRIVALGESLDGAARTLDADGLLVLPGGVDTHCHIEQLEANGTVHEDSFVTASRSAFAGGTTTAICFASQFKGHPIGPTLDEYRRRARAALMDYSFHQIITDPTEQVIEQELPAIVASGIRSFKVFLTYDPLHVDDAQYLRVLAVARKLGAFVTVHCENDQAIRFMTEALLARGMTAPKYHAWSRPKVVEREATHRAIALAELIDQPIQVFHVSCADAAEEIARAQARGVKVWGETCPQYLTLTAAHMDRPGFEGRSSCAAPRRATSPSTSASGRWSSAACWTGSARTIAATPTKAAPARRSTGATRLSATSRTAFPALPRGCRSCSARACRRAGSPPRSSSR
jgi:dihydropyrimidinase